MSAVVKFIEEVSAPRLIRGLVRIAASDGTETTEHILRLEDFRTHIALGQQFLHEHDAAERKKVLPFKKRAAGH